MESVRGLLPFVRRAGEMAVERQGSVSRSYKADGSVLTEVDKDLDEFLRAAVVSLFPGANLISEETKGEIFSDREYTFVVDPLDGSDSYSQGMPGWSVSIGVLDAALRPVAGVLYAPRWGANAGEGALLFADLGKTSVVNGEPASFSPLTRGTPQVMIGSTVHRGFRMDGFPGKVRNIGSTVTHVIAPLLHSAVCGTIFTPNYIWDIAGAHAVALSAGLVMEYFDGEAIDYRPLLERRPADRPIVAGTREGVELIRRGFVLLSAPTS